jgi:hypothetical protein
MWSRLILAAWLAAMLNTGARAQTLRDNPSCSENPLFSRFAGERLSVCERMRFASLELWRWKQPGDPKSGTETYTVEGEYWNYLNEVERDALGRHPSKVEIKRNFEDAVRAAGGTIVGADGSTVSYRLVRPDGEYWGRSGCGRGGSEECAALTHRIVRKTAPTQSVAVLGAAAVAAPDTVAVAPGAVASSPAATQACQAACACNCDGVATGTAGARPGFAPYLRRALRSPLQIDTRVPTQPQVYPPRGTRGMLVHVAGLGLSETTAVYFGDTPARIVRTQGDRLSVLVPEVPSQATTVSLQLPNGRVAVQAPFHVYQLPDASPGRVLVAPCSVPRGDVQTQITVLAPQRAQWGTTLTVTAPGVGALRSRIDEDNANDSIFDGHKAVLGVAFTYEPAPNRSRSSGNADLDAIMGVVPEQSPVASATLVSPDTVSVRVPVRAVSGPVALVAYESYISGGFSIGECRASGPDLIVGPPRP